jgi:HEAT repeat protein
LGQSNLKKGLSSLDEAELLRAKKVVESLIKALKNLMIYPEDNPIPQEQKRRLLQQFSEFLGDYDELKVEIKPSQLCYKGEQIYQDHKENEGLVYCMHRDGIREFAFKKELTYKELSDLLEVFRAGVTSPSLEDDLVTMLWENDFDHIGYQVIDEFIVEETTVNLQQQTPTDFEKIDYSEISLPEEEKTQEDREEKIKVQNILQNIKNFVKEEVIAIDELLEKDESYDGIGETLSVLEEIFSQEVELPEFNEMVTVIEKTMDRLLGEGEFEPSFKIIQLMEELGQGYMEKSPQRATRLAGAVNRAGDSERMKLVSSVLNEKEGLDLKWTKAYLGSLKWNSIFNILNMLGELNTYPLRRMACDVLVDFGRENLDMVARGINDHRWYVVRNVIGILGKIGDPKAISYLKDTIRHDELQVRRETIRALEIIGGPEAAQILVLALDDLSPRIRIRAANLLGKMRDNRALGPLLQVVKDKEFKNKSEEEKKAMLFSVAEMGADQVVMELKKIIKKKSWFDREKYLETRILAVKALGLINSPVAQDTLGELSRKGRGQLREISKRVLERLNRQLTKEGKDDRN